MTIRMVKSSQFAKIAKQAGQNKRSGGKEIFFRFIKQAGWKFASRVAKSSEKSKRACYSIRHFSVGNSDVIYGWTLMKPFFLTN